MKYKTMENLNIKPSLLGFGCMRFPTIKDEEGNSKIDFEETKKMMHYAYDNGVTYFDTAYPYHGGESEIVVGKVIKDFKRDSFYLATKLPMWAVKTEEDVNRLFNEQLNKLQVEYVDFYLLHALAKERFELVKNLKIVDKLIELKKQGKIKYIGFSFHDDYEVFEEIINYYNWDFCQIQLNYMDIDEQAGLKGLELAKSKGIPVVIMEPVKGGFLSKMSSSIENKFKEYNDKASIASWALRYVASLDNVKVVLSGMSSMEQVEDNIKTFADFKPLNKEENAIVDEVRELIRKRVMNPCTGCEYCMPCPQGVNIPWNFAKWNEHAMYGVPWIKKSYIQEDDAKKAINCIECGSCEQVCPQHIQIIEDLKKVTAYFKEE